MFHHEAESDFLSNRLSLVSPWPKFALRMVIGFEIYSPMENSQPDEMAKEIMLEKSTVLMSSESRMEDINRMIGYVPESEFWARKTDITPEQARQKPVSPTTIEEEELRMIGLVPWEKFKARKVPLPSYVPRSKDYYSCVAVTRLSLHETLATHPKIEANHDLRSELDSLTYGMAEQLEGTPVEQCKATVDNVIARWAESLTPERFISTDPLQPLRDANETIRQAVIAAIKENPSLKGIELELDLSELAFDMAKTLAGMPGSERKRLVDAAICDWLEALPVEIRKGLETINAQPVFAETPEFPEFLTPSPSEVEINRSLGIVPWEELKARTVANDAEQEPVFISSASKREDRKRALGIVPLAELLARTTPITPEQVRQKPKATPEDNPSPPVD